MYKLILRKPHSKLNFMTTKMCMKLFMTEKTCEKIFMTQKTCQKNFMTQKTCLNIFMTPKKAIKNFVTRIKFILFYFYYWILWSPFTKKEAFLSPLLSQVSTGANWQSLGTLHGIWSKTTLKPSSHWFLK